MEDTKYALGSVLNHVLLHQTVIGLEAMQQLQMRFANANTTRDGKLTREQASAGMPMVASHFDEIDTQQAGYVTLAQIEGFMRQKAMAR